MEMELKNPATGEVKGTLAEYSPDQVHKAMQNARGAYLGWSSLSLRQRLTYIKNLRLFIADHAEELTREIVFDTGKVYMDALAADIYTTVDTIRYYEKTAVRVLSSRKRKTNPVFWGKRTYVTYRPMGVIAVISPWNYPFQLSIIPVVSALIAGNTVVLKPSEITPLTGLLIERIFKEAGFPDGVVQVIHGGSETGQVVVEAKPDKIFFTGSVSTGRKVSLLAAQNLIPVVLELGGKDPMIVLEDADLEQAANAAVWGGYTNSGQVCMSVERVYVHEKVLESFVSLVTQKTLAIRQGVSDTDDVGSMTFEKQLEIVSSHVKDALEKGARIMTGGYVNPGSMFIPPTVLVDVDHSMKVAREETFGPLLPIIRVETAEEAVMYANQTDFGLNASIWTEDLGHARKIAAQLKVGNVCINDVMINAAVPDLPYGGVKDSGNGRYHGPEGLLAFCHQTAVLENLYSITSRLSWYPYNQEKIVVLHWLISLYSREKKWWSGRAMRALLKVLKGNKPQGPDRKANRTYGV